LVSNQIVVIGNLGYQDERLPGTTPVRVLDLKTFAFSTPKTCGTPPGWIHDHTAELSADRQFILVQRGKVVQGESKSLIENIDDWQLDLKDWRWERLTVTVHGSGTDAFSRRKQTPSWTRCDSEEPVARENGSVPLACP